MKTLIAVVLMGMFLVGCITTGAQRTPITGGAELKISGNTKTINASGNTTVSVDKDGAIEITTEDSVGNFAEAYSKFRGQ